MVVQLNGSSGHRENFVTARSLLSVKCQSIKWVIPLSQNGKARSMDNGEFSSNRDIKNLA